MTAFLLASVTMAYLRGKPGKRQKAGARIGRNEGFTAERLLRPFKANDKGGNVGKRDMELVEEIRQVAVMAEDTEAFLWQVAEVIPERLNQQYLVFVWLLDESGEWLWARAGTGEAGRIGVERLKLRIQLGSRNPVAEAASSGKLFLLNEEEIAKDCRQKGIHRRAPLFAEYWSLSLPLHRKEQVIGVISVYSQDRAFDPALIGRWKPLPLVVVQ